MDARVTWSRAAVLARLVADTAQTSPERRVCPRCLGASKPSTMGDLAVYVFQCANTDLYALTLYPSDDNLPADPCQGRWCYRAQLLMNRRSLGTLPLDASKAIAELRANGIFLAQFGSAMIIFPNQ